MDEKWNSFVEDMNTDSKKNGSKKDEGKKKGSKTKRKSRVFWKIYAVVAGLIALAIAVTLIIFHNFLASYEAAQPVHTMEEVAKIFDNADVDTILSYCAEDYPEEYESVIKSMIVSKLKGEVTYAKKLSVYEENEPAYSLRVDGSEVAIVYLSLDAKRGSFNAKQWSFDYVEGLIDEAETITITAPEGYVLTVDGKTIDETYLTETTVVDSITGQDEVVNYTELPKLCTYTVGNLYGDPEVHCYTADGVTEVAADSAEEDSYTYGFYQDNAISDEMRESLIEVAKVYTDYATNDAEFSSFAKYLYQGTEFYKDMSNAQDGLEWVLAHSSEKGYSEFDVHDYTIYTDSFYTVQVDFTVTVNYTNGQVKENATSLTFYYVQIDGAWELIQIYIG